MLLNNGFPCTPNRLQNNLQARLPCLESNTDLLPLTFPKGPVGRSVDEESLVELREFPLNKAGADHVDDPKLDFFTGDVETAGDHAVRELAVRGGGS